MTCHRNPGASYIYCTVSLTISSLLKVDLILVYLTNAVPE
jgi:hypothetical protein